MPQKIDLILMKETVSLENEFQKNIIHVSKR